MYADYVEDCIAQANVSKIAKVEKSVDEIRRGTWGMGKKKVRGVKAVATSKSGRSETRRWNRAEDEMQNLDLEWRLRRESGEGKTG